MPGMGDFISELPPCNSPSHTHSGLTDNEEELVVDKWAIVLACTLVTWASRWTLASHCTVLTKVAGTNREIICL